MISVLLLLAFAGADDTSFTCSFQRMVSSHRDETGWKVRSPDSFTATVPFQQLVIRRVNGSANLLVEQDGNPLRISGALVGKAVSPQHISWTSEASGYCRLVDTNCVPTLEFYQSSAAQAAVAVRLAAPGRSAGRPDNLTTMDLLYDCVSSQGSERSK